jgi:hypothetical protein
MTFLFAFKLLTRNFEPHELNHVRAARTAATNRTKRKAKQCVQLHLMLTCMESERLYKKPGVKKFKCKTLECKLN